MTQENKERLIQLLSNLPGLPLSGGLFFYICSMLHGVQTNKEKCQVNHTEPLSERNFSLQIRCFFHTKHHLSDAIRIIRTLSDKW